MILNSISLTDQHYLASEIIDLEVIDDLSSQAYEQILDEMEKRQAKKPGAFGHRRAMLKHLVSQNRKRYQDKQFDLDLAQIS